MKFTATNVGKIKPPAGKNDAIVWDDGLPGFAIRFRNQGAGTYIIQYSLEGRDQRVSLGKVAKVPLVDAQIEAKRLFSLIAQKKDPHKERIKAKAEAGENFLARFPAFLVELEKGKPGKKPRSPDYIKAIKRSIETYCSDLHRLGLGEIKRSKVVDVLDEVEEERGYRAAGTTQAHLSSYFGYCMRKGYDGMNPVHGTERRNSVERKRMLDEIELRLIWRATEEVSRYNRIVRLIMLTGMRKTIFGSLRRSEVNQREHRIDVGIEAGKSKNGEEFLLPMSRQVEAMVVEAMRQSNVEFLFNNGDADAEGGFSGWSEAKTALDERIAKLNDGKPIPHWVLHDFRRTFRSLGRDRCKIGDDILDVCLYHVGKAREGTDKNYNKATYLDEKRDAMQRWADFVMSVVGDAQLKAAA